MPAWPARSHISGGRIAYGAGTGRGRVFFGLCHLRCVFCQNWDISQREAGRECTAWEIADMALALQEQGCHSINFVTPEHLVPQVVEAIVVAVRRGLRVPIVYNTNAYISVHSLRFMEGLVDIYMPDLKFWWPDTARKLARAADHPEVAREATAEMHRQVGVLRFGPACGSSPSFRTYSEPIRDESP